MTTLKAPFDMAEIQPTTEYIRLRTNYVQSYCNCNYKKHTTRAALERAIARARQADRDLTTWENAHTQEELEHAVSAYFDAESPME